MGADQNDFEGNYWEITVQSFWNIKHLNLTGPSGLSTGLNSSFKTGKLQWLPWRSHILPKPSTKKSVPEYIWGEKLTMKLLSDAWIYKQCLGNRGELFTKIRQLRSSKQAFSLNLNCSTAHCHETLELFRYRYRCWELHMCGTKQAGARGECNVSQSQINVSKLAIFYTGIQSLYFLCIWSNLSQAIAIISHPYRVSSTQLLKDNKIYIYIFLKRDGIDWYSGSANTQVHVSESVVGKKKSASESLARLIACSETWAGLGLWGFI